MESCLWRSSTPALREAPDSRPRARRWWNQADPGSRDPSLRGQGGAGPPRFRGEGQENPDFKAENDLRSHLGAPGPRPRHRTARLSSAQERARDPAPGARGPSPASSRGARPSRACGRRAGGAPEKPAGRYPCPSAGAIARSPSSPAPRTRPRPASARARAPGASDWRSAGPACRRRLRPAWPWMPAARAPPSQPLPPRRSRLLPPPRLPLRLRFGRPSPAALRLRSGAPHDPRPCLAARRLLIHAPRCGRCPRRPETRWPEPGRHR